MHMSHDIDSISFLLFMVYYRFQCVSIYPLASPSSVILVEVELFISHCSRDIQTILINNICKIGRME